ASRRLSPEASYLARDFCFTLCRGSQGTDSQIKLRNDNLFHPFSKSPIKSLQERGELIRKFGKCPVCEELAKENQKKPAYECPDCGIPTHCSEEHYKNNLIEHKLHTCKMLREFNEDMHDLMSGSQPLDEEINLLNWDTYLYTRGFPSIDLDRSLRHVSKVLTYPITIASVLHQNGPYTLRNRLTTEGLKSLTALRTTLHPKQTSIDIKTLRPGETVRIFIIGARAEAQLPLHLYTQLSYLFPTITFHFHFVGPESLPRGTEPYTTHFNHYLSFTWKNSLYHDYHDTIYPFDPYCDAFFLFNPEEDDTFEFDWILEPGENEFKSLRRDIDIQDVRIGVYPNWGIFGIRGKRYDIRHYDEEEGAIEVKEEDEWEETEEIKRIEAGGMPKQQIRH
ncbi:6133_t:CDS:2, partial [Dentiscutata heterogama]